MIRPPSPTQRTLKRAGRVSILLSFNLSSLADLPKPTLSSALAGL